MNELLEAGLLELEIDCTRCKGTGIDPEVNRNVYNPYVGCKDCGGKKKVMTEFGRKVQAFVAGRLNIKV